MGSELRRQRPGSDQHQRGLTVGPPATARPLHIVYRAVRLETGQTQEQVSVLFQSAAARNLGSSEAAADTRDVALARRWGLAPVAFQLPGVEPLGPLVSSPRRIPVLLPHRDRKDAGQLGIGGTNAAQPYDRGREDRINGHGSTSASLSSVARLSRSARTSTSDSRRVSSSMSSSCATGSSLATSCSTTKPLMRGAVPRPLHVVYRAVRQETGQTQEQVPVLFQSAAARNHDIGSREAAADTREVSLARRWGLALVAFQLSFILLFIIASIMDRIF